MQDKIEHIEVDNIKYPLVFNLNVIEKIQEEYETIEKWGDLTDGQEREDGTKREVNIKALKFGITEMINEGIDIENEDLDIKRDMLTTKQVGRIITKIGADKILTDVHKTVTNSTKQEDDNEKNV